MEGQVPGWFREQLISECAQAEPCGTAADNTDRHEAKRSRKASGGGPRRASLDGREEAGEGGSVLRVKLQMCDTLYRLLQGEPSTWRWHSSLRTATKELVEAAADVGDANVLCRSSHVKERTLSTVDSVEVERDYLAIATRARSPGVHMRHCSVGATDSGSHC